MHFPEIQWGFSQMKWHGPERACWRVYRAGISAERNKVIKNAVFMRILLFRFSALTYRILVT